MKKALALVTAILMLVCCAACESDNAQADKPSTIMLHTATEDTAEPVSVDVSHMENPYVYCNMILDLPKNFIVDEEKNKELGVNMAYKGSTTSSTDCYIFDQSGFKQSLEDFDKQELKDKFREEFSGFVDFDSYTTTTCCGFDAISISFSRKVMDSDIYQRQYYILTDTTTYIITYTTEVKRNLTQYNNCIESIIIK